MRGVVQRVLSAGVKVDGDLMGQIGQGILLLLGIGKEDTEEDLDYLVGKILNLRIFEDSEGKMNKSIKDIGGELLVVPQFTLYGDVRKGRRPNFMNSASPNIGNEYFEKFVELCLEQGIKTEKGIFGADMKVELVNDGPVTILLDSKKIF